MARPDAPAWPPEHEVQAVHTRYQVEVVEGLNLCPFARKSRELGRVHRPVFRLAAAEQTPQAAAGPVALALAELVGRFEDAEIVLLTFPVRRGHPFASPRAFEALVPVLRDTYAAEAERPVFYMVAFHPGVPAPDPAQTTRDNLVPLIRRSPDPVIQCVRADTLDAVRRQAQEVAQARMRRELLALHPELASLVDRSVAPDPELSRDIAQANFEAVGSGPGRAELERRIAHILLDRDRRYGELSGSENTSDRADTPRAPPGPRRDR